MTKKEKLKVCEAVESEGFDYIFVHGSNFENIKDQHFQSLVRDYIAAQEALSDYIGYEGFLENQ